MREYKYVNVNRRHRNIVFYLYEDDNRKAGLPPASFWQQQLELQEKRLEEIRKIRKANSPETVKPGQPPEDNHLPPPKRKKEITNYIQIKEQT